MDSNGATSLARFAAVQSPFVNQHQAMLSASTASASYSISFDAQSLDFVASTAIAAQGSPPALQSGCNGTLRFFVDQPVLLTANVQFTFAMPSGDRQLDLSVNVGSTTTTYFHDGTGYQPVFGDPASGTWTSHADSILLPANQTYGIGYSFQFLSFSGSPTQLSQGNGIVHFRLDTIPEPATSTLLALSAIALAKRRRGVNRP